MGRPSSWNGPTTAIRVPSSAVDRVLEVARAIDAGDDGNFVQNSEEVLAEDLANQFIARLDAEAIPQESRRQLLLRLQLEMLWQFLQQFTEREQQQFTALLLDRVFGLGEAGDRSEPSADHALADDAAR